MNPVRPSLWVWGLVMMSSGILSLTSCGSSPSDSSAMLLLPNGVRSDHINHLSGDDVVHTLQVNSIEIQVLDSFPVEVQVRVLGLMMPSTCSELDEPQIDFQSDRFTVLLSATLTSEVCTLQLQDFEQVIPLDTDGLSAGTYQVEVNGVTAQFELSIDNSLGHLDQGMLL